MFLHFYAFEHLIRGNQPEFLNGPVWAWEISPKKESALLTNFKKLSNFPETIVVLFTNYQR